MTTPCELQGVRNRSLLLGKTWLRGGAHLVLALMLARASAEVRYVNVSNTTPNPPYADWASAATTIQDAVDAALEGDTVMVTNGTYNAGGRSVGSSLLTNRVVVSQGIRLQSVNGPLVTTIEGAPSPNGELVVLIEHHFIT